MDLAAPVPALAASVVANSQALTDQDVRCVFTGNVEPSAFAIVTAILTQGLESGIATLQEFLHPLGSPLAQFELIRTPGVVRLRCIKPDKAITFSVQVQCVAINGHERAKDGTHE